MSNFSTTLEFGEAAKISPPAKPCKRVRPAPLSIRVSEDERARLKEFAAGGSIHSYIRDRLFGAGASSSRAVRRSNSIDRAALGRVLGALGQSRLASNLNQIAKAANMGALPVTPELEAELSEACAAIADMRQRLISAMGIKAK